MRRWPRSTEPGSRRNWPSTRASACRSKPCWINEARRTRASVFKAWKNSRGEWANVPRSANRLHPLRDVVNDLLIDRSCLLILFRYGLALALLEQVVQVGIEMKNGIGAAAEGGAEAFEVSLRDLIIAAALQHQGRDAFEGGGDSRRVDRLQ